MALIHDVIAPVKSEALALAQVTADINYVEHIPEHILVTELFARGITIADIFGMYYAIEEMYNHRDDEQFGSSEAGHHGRPPLTVGDAELAGFTSLPPTPVNSQPF